MKLETSNSFELSPEPLIISDADQVDSLTALIHDEYCELDLIQFDPTAKSIVIPFSRVFHDRGAIAHHKWLPIKEVPVLRCSLTIQHVEQSSLDVLRNINELDLMMSEIEYDPDSKTIKIDMGEIFEIKVSELEIEYREQEYRGKIRMGSFGLFDWNSGTVSNWPG